MMQLATRASRSLPIQPHRQCDAWVHGAHMGSDSGGRAPCRARGQPTCMGTVPSVLGRATSCGWPTRSSEPLQGCVRTGVVSTAVHGRHPEYADASARDLQPKARPREDIEADDRYARVDSSEVHAWEARRAFAAALVGGEAAARLGEAALWVSAEDDAVASHSTVPFPVSSYLGRIDTIARDVRARLASTNVAAADGRVPAAVDPSTVLRVVEGVLFTGSGSQQQQGLQGGGLPSLGFRAPPHGRSKVPRNVVVDHAGTWEDARDGYMHEVLVRRRGHPAALAILYSEVMARLLQWGVVEFVTAMDLRGYAGLPRGVVLPGITRASLLASSSSGRGGSSAGSSGSSAGTVYLNACSTDTLAELQRHLKRTYWPWAWDNTDALDAVAGPGGVASHGGFRAAAKAAVGDELSATIRAVSTVAAWRLERGIWTSPGAGDLRRAVCACQRLVMLRGDAVPDERRDLAVALMHGGALGAARAELRAYMDTTHFRTTADPFDKTLCYRMMELLASTGDSITEPQELVSMQAALTTPPPAPGPPVARKPLTW